MERRTVIKNLGLALGSLSSLPTWAAHWNHATIATSTVFDNEILLAELVETFIPTTDTLGAKGLNVHKFIQKMLADCYHKQAQTDFEKILLTINPLSINAFGKPFAEGTSAQRTQLLQSLAQSKDNIVQNFYRTLRGLTVQGYTQSEYYMTRFTDYEMAPARFYGCVPIKK
jgi:Gluconate 2-dehydrogenase subunit 3